MTTSPSDTSTTRVLAVVGPTAVGKTALAEELAVRLRGEIVSADSMQVYRGMDIGTAKPAVHERRVPYHCTDLVAPGESFSAAVFQKCARDAIDGIASRGALPVVAGGTGLYVRAALDDMRFPAGEQAGNAERDRWEAYAREHGADALHLELERVDPASAALIHPNNERRVVRAFELLADGTSYAEQHAGFSARRSVYDTRFVGLTMERELLYRRIDERVDAMVATGLLGEVEGLLERGLRDALTAAQAIGYKELVPVIEAGAGAAVAGAAGAGVGATGAALEEAVAAIKQASRRYAKRQLTWFRADPRVRWVDVTELSPSQAADAAIAALDWFDDQ